MKGKFEQFELRTINSSAGLKATPPVAQEDVHLGVLECFVFTCIGVLSDESCVNPTISLK